MTSQFSGFLSAPVLIQNKVTPLVFNSLTDASGNLQGVNNGMLQGNKIIIPSSGLYQYNVGITFKWNHNDQRRDLSIYLRKNGVNVVRSLFYYDENDNETFSNSRAFYFETGDEIDVAFEVDIVNYPNQLIQVTPVSSFSIYKV